MKDNFEEWYKNYKQSGAFIIAFKEKDSENCKVRYIGNTIEVMYIFEEIVRELNKNVSKELLDKCYEIAFEEEIGE